MHTNRENRDDRKSPKGSKDGWAPCAHTQGKIKSCIFMLDVVSRNWAGNVTASCTRMPQI